MPDLDDQFAGLREHLRDAVHQPDLGTVIERSRQRTALRRTQLGAILAVLAVGAAVPVLRGATGPVPHAPAPVTTSAQPSVEPGPPFRYNVQFADPRHGFATRARCTGTTALDCKTELLVTEDGGARAVLRSDRAVADAASVRRRAAGRGDPAGRRLVGRRHRPGEWADGALGEPRRRAELVDQGAAGHAELGAVDPDERARVDAV